MGITDCLYLFSIFFFVKNTLLKLTVKLVIYCISMAKLVMEKSAIYRMASHSEARLGGLVPEIYEELLKKQEMNNSIFMLHAGSE